jgi:hypothetical protein
VVDDAGGAHHLGTLLLRNVCMPGWDRCSGFFRFHACGLICVRRRIHTSSTTRHGCLQLLLQKKPFFDVGIETSSVSVRGFCMAVLSALKRFNALDQDAFIQVLYDNPEQCRLLSRAFAKTNDPVMYHLWIRGLLITILPYTSFSAALISTFGIPTR